MIPKTTPKFEELPQYRAREQGRVYLEVLVTPTIAGWRGVCNECKFKIPGKDDPVRAAWGAAEVAFTEYFDRNVSWTEIRLERETPWEFVASMPNE
jgi:hypothetical protein